MKKEARCSEILNMLATTKAVTSTELSKYFHVTEETIRKDLFYLSEKGQIIRTFGGATLKENVEQSLEQRIVRNYRQKMKIAYEVAKLIKPRDLIVIDAGSTSMLLAKMIQPNSDVIVITNSLENINILANIEGITVVGTGGTLSNKSMSFRGILAEKAISSYNLQKAFISCAAVDAQRGIMDTSEQEVRVKLRMIDETEEVYLLADSSKFNRIAHVTVCDFSRITAIITDDEIDLETVEKFKHIGVNIIIAT